MDSHMSVKQSVLQFFSVFIIIVTMSSCSPAQIRTSPESDKEIGAEVAKQVEQQIGIYEAEATTEYFRQIGERLVGNLEEPEFDFQFQIADQWEPNAFAVPGGYIYISRGLLILANQEGELAGVIGHEISHVTERHSASQQQRAIAPALLTVPGAIVGSVVSEDLGNLINTPIAMIGQVTLASYSRKHENEADKVGMRLSAKSGYDPLLLAVSLERLEKDVEMLTERKREFSFFDSHPMTPDRVDDIQREAKKIEWTLEPAVSKSRKDFLQRLDGLYYYENPAQGIFQDQKFLHPDLNFTITFPEKWKAVNTPSLVGAYMENQEAMIFINGIGEAADPAELGKAFVKELQEKHKTTPESVRSDKIGEWPAYLVIITDKSARSPAHIYYLWVTMGKLTYQLIGAGADQYKEQLRETVFSLRPLTKKERNSITGIRLRIVKAKAGEDLSELSKRSGNVWSPAYTAMMNNMPEDVKLPEGELVKIAREEQYKPGKK